MFGSVMLECTVIDDQSVLEEFLQPTGKRCVPFFLREKVSARMGRKERKIRYGKWNE